MSPNTGGQVRRNTNGSNLNAEGLKNDGDNNAAGSSARGAAHSQNQQRQAQGTG